ncbi:MAG: hypothetical protein C0413_02795 [Clostridiales bacterium]|nr:hypothetical protein [Clostridiales bacterium]
MKRKLFTGIIGGLIGFIVGAIGGGYIGFVVGGTFLGGLEIYKHTGFEGYELAAYIGVVIGTIAASISGAFLALKIHANAENKKQ